MSAIWGKYSPEPTRASGPGPSGVVIASRASLVAPSGSSRDVRKYHSLVLPASTSIADASAPLGGGHRDNHATVEADPQFPVPEPRPATLLDDGAECSTIEPAE